MKLFISISLTILFLCTVVHANEIDKSLKDEFADNNGVKIHYVVKGSGPLIVFVHGFPDFWYSWRHQLEGLSTDYRVVAMDTRGYNKSDKPKGQENYHMMILVDDVKAVIEHENRNEAIIVGHDWGGMIAWHFVTTYPKLTDKLIILNLPYPKNFARELTHNPEQQKNSAYARGFQLPESHKILSADALATISARGDVKLKEIYLAAYERSSLESMMQYYRENFPKVPYTDIEFPKIKMPLLQFHGLDDSTLLPTGLNGTWNEALKDYTLVTLPGSGHWPHHDSPEMVTETMRWWLRMRN